MSEIISRRDFLKVAVIGTATTITEACAPEPLKPSNIIPSLTPTRLETTKTLEPTLDPFSSVEAKGWVEKEDGSIDAGKLFPFVGDWKFTTPDSRQLATSKNRAVDLMWEGMRLVYEGEQDVHQEGFDQNAYRSYIAGQLNNQIELKRKFTEIKDKLPSQDLKPYLMTIVINGPDFSNQTANLVDGVNEANSIITGIADTANDTFKWYRINGDELERLTNEDEPVLLPPLRSEGGRLLRVDNGEEVMMRGLNNGIFQMNLDYDSSSTRVNNTFTEYKNAGANFITISLRKDAIDAQSARYYLKLGEVLELARNKYGFRVLLIIGWENERKMINLVDENMPKNWNTMLNFKDETNPYMDKDQNLASMLRNKVDVFQMISEPQGDFSLFNQYLDAACAEIRNTVGPEAICGFSNGHFFATGAVELLGREQEWLSTHPNSVVVIHPFKLDNPVNPNDPLKSDRPDPRLYLHTLKERGVAVVVGESGWLDWDQNYDWLMVGDAYGPGLFQYLEDNNISYATDDWTRISGFWEKLQNQKTNNK